MAGRGWRITAALKLKSFSAVFHFKTAICSSLIGAQNKNPGRFRSGAFYFELSKS